MTRTRTPELRQWPYGDKLLTTVHHIDRDGKESIEIASVSEKLELELEDRGHEMVLKERARPHR